MPDLNHFNQIISENLFTVISIPIIAALIGWITNYVAVKMIFRPRKPISILGIKIQGLIPRRQRDLAEKIGETIERDLLSHKDIEKVLQGKDIEDHISQILGEQIDKFLQQFVGKNPMLAMFLQGEMLTQVKTALIEQMKTVVPSLLDNVMQKVETNLDFKKVVSDKIVAFDLSKLESIIYEISAKELKTIEILGGVLGFVVGLAQVAIMLLSH